MMKVTRSNARDMKYVRALVHGDSGMGKTTSLGTLPEDITLLVGMERSLLPLRNRDYAVCLCETWQDLRELHGAMRNAEVAQDGSISFELAGEPISGIKIVAFDSLSEINELCKRQIVEVDRKAVLSERSKGRMDTPEGIYDDQMTMEDWGALGRRMQGLVNAINHLPVHTIFTCLAAWQENKRTGELHRVPGLNGKLAQEVPAFFDLVFHMEDMSDGEEPHRVWRTRNDGVHLCKDSTGVLDEFIQPNWMQVFARILGSNGNSKPKSSSNSKKEKQNA